LAAKVEPLVEVFEQFEDLGMRQVRICSGAICTPRSLIAAAFGLRHGAAASHSHSASPVALRGMLWYAALTKDPGLGPVALTPFDAHWKAKRNVD
jgi:hypothetical protein